MYRTFQISLMLTIEAFILKSAFLQLSLSLFFCFTKDTLI